MIENSFHTETSMDSYEFELNTNQILKEVLVGLSKSQKALPPKLLYDKKGSEIFEDICEVEEYYPTRTEKKILDQNASEMAEFMGEDVLLIEPGSGSGEKVRTLLPKLKSPKGFVPIEISREILYRMTDEIHEEFPTIRVLPVCADFTSDLELPLTVDSHAGKKVIFFPGSTIGNFTPTEAVGFLKKYGRMIGQGGGLLIGVDLKKDPEILKVAYDDPKGVTADFNLNLLERLNREVGANFERENFYHEAFYNEKRGCVEMHLVSKVPQLVRINQTVYRFREGETIHTESSYKYSVGEFIELGARAKFEIKKYWKDENDLFCVYYFERI